MIWIKDNGQEIEINDRPESIEYCTSLGWTPADKKAPKKAAKKKSAK